MPNVPNQHDMLHIKSYRIPEASLFKIQVLLRVLVLSLNV